MARVRAPGSPNRYQAGKKDSHLPFQSETVSQTLGDCVTVGDQRKWTGANAPSLGSLGPQEEQLDKDDYQYLDKILHHADVGGVLNGMRHTQAPNVEELIADVPSIELKIDIDRLRMDLAS